MGVKECLEQACEEAENSATASSESATAAGNSATAAQLEKWHAEAWKKTADSYATEGENIFVKVYTSDGDGTFTATNTTEYSAKHYKIKSEAGTSNYRGTHDTLDLANSGVVNPVAGDFVLINDGYSLWPSFYDARISKETFIKNVASIYGGNSFYGGQTLQWEVLLDGGMIPNPTPTPNLAEANDFYLKDIAEPIEIQNPTGMPIYSSYIKKGIFFIEPNGFPVTWGSLYDSTAAFTWDHTKINRFNYHTFEGRVKYTWAGVI